MYVRISLFPRFCECYVVGFAHLTVFPQHRHQLPARLSFRFLNRQIRFRTKPVNPFSKTANPFSKPVNPFSKPVNLFSKPVNPFSDRQIHACQPLHKLFTGLLWCQIVFFLFDHQFLIFWLMIAPVRLII
jgi:hypothetical protein